MLPARAALAPGASSFHKNVDTIMMNTVGVLSRVPLAVPTDLISESASGKNDDRVGKYSWAAETECRITNF
jgi:hypothetical protein